MRFAVLASAESWYLKDLARAASGRHELLQVTFCDLASTLLADRASVASGPTRLDGLDAVIVRTMPPGSLEQVVFRMDALARLEAAGTPVLNPPKAVEAAVDKYLTSARLAAAGLTIPRTMVCQTAEAAMTALVELGGDVVLKPLFGAEGRGITRLNDEALALRAFKMLEQLGAVLYLQEFVPHEGADLRLLVIGRRVLGMRRRNPLDWRTNVSRGATAEPLEVTPELAELAHRAAAAVGAPLAGVDLLPGKDGRLYAIEVNAVPGWKALARALKLDVAKLVLDYVEDCVSTRRVGDLSAIR
ncbi:MAG TPA: RimK family alpha-L-glutamate ligase [Pirellulales bacterium]|nr:RimK family alpha-L-glutamate ligase [Pirellulales bacterium]